MKLNTILTLSIFAVSSIGNAQTNSFPSSGNVGIGTSSPDSPLHIDYDTDSAVDTFILDDNSASGPTFRIRKPSTGTAGYISWIGNAKMSLGTRYGSDLVIDRGNGRIGIGTSSPDKDFVLERTGSAILKVETTASSGFASLRAKAKSGGKSRLDFANPSNVDVGQIRYEHSSDTMFFRVSNADRFVVDSNGNMGVGTLDPDGYRLAVSGTIRAKEVIVDTGWSDFVFENSYQLRALDDVESYIEEHGHLPDVPSASVVESEGLSVGEAQKIMMQKIEELTLYMIEQEKKNQAQQKEIEELRKHLSQQNARYNSE